MARVDAERNRARLLDVARAAFSAGDPVALEQVARDAGVGIGTLYRHFPTREALVEAIYRKELGDLCASAADLLAVHPPDRALRCWMSRYADFIEAKQGMADAIRAVRAAGGISVPSARQDMADAARTILEAGAADGTLRAGVRPEDVVGLIIGCLTATSVSGGREQLERMFDLLMDALQAG